MGSVLTRVLIRWPTRLLSWARRRLAPCAAAGRANPAAHDTYGGQRRAGHPPCGPGNADRGGIGSIQPESHTRGRPVHIAVAARDGHRTREKAQGKDRSHFFCSSTAPMAEVLGAEDAHSMQRLGELAVRHSDQGIAPDIESLTMAEALGVLRYLANVHSRTEFA